MKKQPSVCFSLTMALVFAFGALVAPGAARAQEISQTAMAGPYAITLKVLPAESFTGPQAEMARDGGARADALNGPGHPNHHLVAFVEKSGKPVERATVSIRYRETSPAKGRWMRLPVARMHVAGKGLATTHYGNNVKLEPGSYEARVTVNGSAPAAFHFSLSR
jgi:hypothetical protein